MSNPTPLFQLAGEAVKKRGDETQAKQNAEKASLLHHSERLQRRFEEALGPEVVEALSLFGFSFQAMEPSESILGWGETPKRKFRIEVSGRIGFGSSYIVDLLAIDPEHGPIEGTVGEFEILRRIGDGPPFIQEHDLAFRDAFLEWIHLHIANA